MAVQVLVSHMTGGILNDITYFPDNGVAFEHILTQMEQGPEHNEDEWHICAVPPLHSRKTDIVFLTVTNSHDEWQEDIEFLRSTLAALSARDA